MTQQYTPISEAGSGSTPADALPVIDLSLAEGSPDDRRRLHDELRAAATGVGFFQLVGHGVTPEEPPRSRRPCAPSSRSPKPTGSP